MTLALQIISIIAFSAVIVGIMEVAKAICDEITKDGNIND